MISSETMLKISEVCFYIFLVLTVFVVALVILKELVRAREEKEMLEF